MKPETFWQKIENKVINIDFPEALKKPLDPLSSNVRGARVKKAEGIDFDA